MTRTACLPGVKLGIVVFAHVFPLTDEEGRAIGWERRTYDDAVTLIEH